MKNNRELWSDAVQVLGENELTRRYRAWISGIIKKSQAKAQNMSLDELFLQDAQIILTDLNNRTKRRYRLNDATIVMIRGRISEGYTVEDFIKCHEVMCLRWQNDAKMTEYLRPSTLYRPVHFAEYVALWDGTIGLRTAVTEGKHIVKAERKELDPSLRWNDEALTPCPSPTRGEGSSPGDGQTHKSGQTHRSAPPEPMREWDSFETWAEFMRWTFMNLDSDKSLAKYEMPERIRRMRVAPGMVMSVLKGQSPAWAETEYAQIKNNQGR